MFRLLEVSRTPEEFLPTPVLLNSNSCLLPEFSKFNCYLTMIAVVFLLTNFVPSVAESDSFTFLDCFSEARFGARERNFCLDSVLSHATGEGEVHQFLKTVNDTWYVCENGEKEKVESRGCRSLTYLATEVITKAVGLLQVCGSDDGDFMSRSAGDTTCPDWLWQVAENIVGR